MLALAFLVVKFCHICLDMTNTNMEVMSARNHK